MHPHEPTPPTDNRGIRRPLLLNGALVLVLAGLAYAGNDNPSEAALTLLLALAGLVALNLVALVVVALTWKGQWITGFALSVALLLLIGLGTCGLMATAA